MAGRMHYKFSLSQNYSCHVNKTEYGENSTQAWVSWPGGQEGPCPLNFLDIVGFSEMLMARRKIFGILLLVKLKALKFIGKPLNLAPLQVPRHPCTHAQFFETLDRRNINRYREFLRIK